MRNLKKKMYLTDQNIPQSSLIRACITPIELNTQDFGFSIMYDHLDGIRSCCKNISQFKRNAKLVLNDQSRFDPLLEEAFRLVERFLHVSTLII